jgi:hypothetical protein
MIKVVRKVAYFFYFSDFRLRIFILQSVSHFDHSHAARAYCHNVSDIPEEGQSFSVSHTAGSDHERSDIPQKLFILPVGDLRKTNQQL